MGFGFKAAPAVVDLIDLGGTLRVQALGFGL